MAGKFSTIWLHVASIVHRLPWLCGRKSQFHFMLFKIIGFNWWNFCRPRYEIWNDDHYIGIASSLMSHDITDKYIVGYTLYFSVSAYYIEDYKAWHWATHNISSPRNFYFGWMDLNSKNNFLKNLSQKTRQLYLWDIIFFICLWNDCVPFRAAHLNGSVNTIRK